MKIGKCRGCGKDIDFDTHPQGVCSAECYDKIMDSDEERTLIAECEANIVKTSQGKMSAHQYDAFIDKQREKTFQKHKKQ